MHSQKVAGGDIGEHNTFVILAQARAILFDINNDFLKDTEQRLFAGFITSDLLAFFETVYFCLTDIPILAVSDGWELNHNEEVIVSSRNVPSPIKINPQVPRALNNLVAGFIRRNKNEGEITLSKMIDFVDEFRMVASKIIAAQNKPELPRPNQTLSQI